MNKKGDFTLQFNWIFVLFVGGIILIGILAILPKIKKAAVVDLSYEIKEYSLNFLTMAGLNPDVELEENIGEYDLYFSCNSYSVEKSDTSQSIEYNIIFSPDVIKDKIVSYSYYFETPFKSVSAVFATSPNIKYLMSENEKKLFNLLPNNMNKEITQDFTNENYYKIRYLAFNDIPSTSIFKNTQNLKDKDISALKIEIMEDEMNFPDSFGKITYYGKKGNDFEEKSNVYFFDKATLLGAIYSENNETYLCMMNKAFRGMRILLDVEEERIKKISTYETTGHCDYSKAYQHITQLKELFKKEISEDTMKQIYNIKKNLLKENRYLERISCPLIY